MILVLKVQFWEYILYLYVRFMFSFCLVLNTRFMLKTKKEQYFADEIWKINQDMFSDNN